MSKGYAWNVYGAAARLRRLISKKITSNADGSIQFKAVTSPVSLVKKWSGKLVCVALLMGMTQVVHANADLVLNHTVDKASAAATEEVVYTLRITNNGPDTSEGIELTDILPATTSYVGYTTDQGNCSHSGEPSGGTLTCTIGTLANAGEATVTLTAIITDSTPTTIVNTASVSATTPDPDMDNNEVLRNVTVTSGTDLEMTLSGTPDPDVDSGGVLTYTASVENLGPDTASNLSSTINLAPGFSRTGSLPSGCSQSGQVVTCTRSSLTSGSTWSIGSISGVVSAAGPSSISTTASVGSDIFDGNNSNNTSIVNTTVNQATDVSVTMSRTGGSLVQLDEFIINLNPRYSGGQPQNLTMTATLDPAFQILTAGPFSQNGWDCSISGQDISCTRPNGGGSTDGEYNYNIGQVSLDVRAIAFGSNLPNSVSIAAVSPSDTELSNNTHNFPITVQEPSFDLQALKSGPSQTLRVVGGETFPFSIRVRNNSNVAFVGELTMTDTLPAGLRVESYSLNGWVCTSTDDPLPVNGPATITCTRTYTAGSPLAAGATTPAVIMTTTATATGTHSNQMCVTNTPEGGYSYPADSVPGNDCVSSGVEGQNNTNSADIQVIKTGDATVVASDLLTYQIEIVNAGPATAESVTLSDEFTSLFNGGPGNGFEGASVSSGVATLDSCTNAAAANVTSRNLTCAFTEIPVCTQGSNCPVVTVQVRPMGNTTSGVDITRTNTASAYSSVTSDPAYGNNTDDHDTTITPRADISAVKTANWSGAPNPIAAGTDLTYTITVSNETTGASGASDVSITDTLPDDLTFVSATASGGGSCTAAPTVGSTTSVGNNEVSCGWSSVQRNGQRTATIIVRPNHGTEGETLINQVTSSTLTAEVTLDNNDDDVSVEVADARVDLATAQVDSPDPLQVGDTVTYTLTVTNFGPSVASGVRVYNSLPTSGLSFQGFEQMNGTPGLPAGITCSSEPVVGSFGAGAVPAAVYTGLNGEWDPALEAADIICEISDVMLLNDSVSFRVLLDAEERGVYTNYVIARSQEHRDGKSDPNPVNDTEPENTTVRIQADMEVVSKTVVDANVAILQPFDYTVVVRNNGPNEALGVQFTDHLPDGMVLTGPPSMDVTSGSFESTVCSGVAGESSVICELGTVSNGANATITIPVRIIEWTGPTLSNTAIVSVNNLTYDNDPSNNEQSVVVNVERLTLSGRVFQKDDPTQPADPFNTPPDAAIGGVAITVSGEDVGGNPINITRLTDPDGTYDFDLPPSGPEGYTVTRGGVPFSVQDEGAQLGTGADEAGSVTSADVMEGIVLNATNGTGVDYDFWVATNEITLQPPTISGYVYFDHNRNRERPSVPNQDPLVQDWTVTLWADLNDGEREKVCELKTDQYGFYQFDNVRCNAAGYDQWATSGLPVSGDQPAGFSDSIDTFTIEFSSDDGLAGEPQSGGSAGTEQPRSITGITLNGGDNITEQNLPIDPAGVIYDSLTRQPVSGAQVFFEDENGLLVDPNCLVGGINPIVTNATGIYQFLLDPGAPGCGAYSHVAAQEYSLRVVAPAGYLPGPSEMIPACTNALDVGNPGPFDVQNSDNPPPESATQHDPALCPVSTAGLNPLNQASTQYYFLFNLITSGGGASGDVVRNHIPLDPILGGAVRVVKTTPKSDVTRGELVPYQIKATNTLAAVLTDIVIEDQIPPGFQYVLGSAQLNGVVSEPDINGRHLRWPAQTLAAGEEVTVQLLLVVGSGVEFNEYVNRAWAMNSLANTRVSNIATAAVRVVPDPIFDCTDIIGQVFDDHNRDGYQNEGEPGIPGVRLVSPRGWLITTDDHGRFHVACADVPSEMRGGNFILKLDERSLPSGYRVTTENPRVVRVTQGRMVKLNFGAAIHRIVRLDLTSAVFTAEHELKPNYAKQMQQLLPLLHEEPSILRIAYQLEVGGDIGHARERIGGVRAWLEEHWEEQGCCYDLRIEEEIVPGVERIEVTQ